MYTDGSDAAELRVSDLPRGVRPREKMIQGGARGLSHVELLAVILGTGTRKENVLKVAERLVRRYGVSAMPSLTVKEWMGNPGVGDARACRLAALFELARRVEKAASREAPRITSPKEVHAQVRDLATAKKEHLIGLYLDSQNHLLARETISIGSLNTTRTHPREILQPAITHLALGFILVHNHPSGTLVPSSDDVEFTRAISRAGDLMGIPLYDHVIVSREGFVSLKEKGML
jgi:DNA repair protein RadC